MKIRDVMRHGPITIPARDTLGTAQRTMARAHIRHLPVIDDHAKVVGMLSERDVLAARAARTTDWWTTPVTAAMSTPVHTAAPDDSLTEVAARLAVEQLGAMPVVELGKLVGVATVSDVLDAEVREAMAPAPVRLMTAADAMTPWPYTVSPEASLTDAVATMFDRHIRHLPVVAATSSACSRNATCGPRSASRCNTSRFAPRCTCASRTS
jgi:CBS domain-containing protein